MMYLICNLEGCKIHSDYKAVEVVDVYKAIKVGVILFKVILPTNLYKSVSQMVLSKRTRIE